YLLFQSYSCYLRYIYSIPTRRSSDLGGRHGEGGCRSEALLCRRLPPGNAGPGPALRDHGAVPGEPAIGGHGGVAVDAELLREGAHRRGQVTGGELARLDESPRAAGDLRCSGAADLQGLVRFHTLESMSAGSAVDCDAAS